MKKQIWCSLMVFVMAVTSLFLLNLYVMNTSARKRPPGRFHMDDHETHHSSARKISGTKHSTTIPFIGPTPTKSRYKEVDSAIKERKVAIGLGITTRGRKRKLKPLKPETALTELVFFRRLMLSFCQTASYGFEYHFYLGHDHTDSFFKRHITNSTFSQYSHEFISQNCPDYINATVHLVECSHSGRPAWAQNDAMMAAYKENMSYYYRVNDDTMMQTRGWTERMILQLLRFNPPNIGVAGPWFREGNTAILTHDFVHRTHIEIFGYYYPRVFTDWFADDWITGIYRPDKCKKVAGVRVKHTLELGTRYAVHYRKRKHLAMMVQTGKNLISRYVLERDENYKGDLVGRNATSVIG